MIGTRGLARTLIAGTFVAGGVAAWKRSAKLAPTAENVAEPLESALGRAVDSEQIVKANVAVQIAAGGLFALGIAPRPMALVLAASLVPTTIAGHAFWDVDDPSERQAQTLQFLKNASILGGLVFAALDTGGRPSVFWRGRQLAGELGSSISATTSSIADTLPT